MSQVNASATSAPFSIVKQLSEMHPDVRAAYEYHLGGLDQLARQMSPYGVRDDSRLAFRYAGGQLPNWSVHAVAHEMACTQYVCDHFPYQPLLQPYLRTFAEGLRKSTGADWKRVWAAVADLGPEMLKLQLLCDAGWQLPDFAPLSSEA